MAQGLRCPHCGHKHPVAQLQGTPTFQCAGCGQVLKTPREYRSPPGGAPGVANADAPRAAAPSTYQRPPRVPPRRVGGEVPRTRRDPVVAGDATEALPTAAPRVRPQMRSTPAANGAAPSAATAPLAWPWRALVWIIALPVGLLLVVFIARWLGLLTGNNLFDVISGTGIGRYLRLFALAPFAALVVATIAHVVLERLPIILEQRRTGSRRGGGGSSGPPGDAYGDPRRAARGASQRAARPAGRRTTS
jgi:hypothetical protein